MTIGNAIGILETVDEATRGETIMRDALKIAAQSAEERGWQARRDNRGKDECPCYSPTLRLAWLAGWNRANLSMF